MHNRLYDINDRGSVVGQSIGYDGPETVRRAVLWERGRVQDLNTLIPSGTGWELNDARRINNAGQILVLGTYGSLSQGYLLLVPSAPADLALSTFLTAPNPADAGKEMACSVGVHNGGPGAATGVKLTVTLPPGVTFLRSDPPTTPASGKLVFDLGALARGDARRPSFRITARDAGSYPLTAALSGQEQDPNTRNNTRTATARFRALSADVSLTMRGNWAPDNRWDSWVTVSNAGPGDASTVAVEYTLPDGATVDGTLAERGTVIREGRKLRWQVGGLRVRTSSSLRVKLLTEPGPFRCEARATLSQRDPNPGNNIAGVEGVGPGPDLNPLISARLRQLAGGRQPRYVIALELIVSNYGRERSLIRTPVEYWLSTDRLLSRDDRPLPPPESLPPLKDGDDRGFDRQIPTTRDPRTGGTPLKGKFIIAVVDPQHQVQEENEFNNTHSVELP